MQDLPIILLGVGGVARALLRQIIEHRSFHAIHYGLNLPILAVCDRNGAIVEPNSGLDDVTLADLLAL